MRSGPVRSEWQLDLFCLFAGGTAELKVGLNDFRYLPIGVDYDECSPFVEGQAGVADVESKHVADAQIVVGMDAQECVLVHQLRHFPMGGG
jgi:hypothetical protein